MARPLDPLDFETRPGIADTGWPVSAADLETAYRRAQEIAGLGRFGYELADWPADANPAFALPRDRVVTHLFQRGATRFSRYRDELAESPDIRVIHHATVLRLDSDGDSGLIKEAIVATGGGRGFSVAARRFVLATGGIENPRLLLASTTPDRPKGLANEHNLVGRFFMERLSTRAGVLMPADTSRGADARLYQSHIVAGTRVQASLSLAPDVIRDERLRTATFWVLERSRAAASPGLRSMLSMYRYAHRRPLDRRAIAAHALNVARDLPGVLATGIELARRRGRLEQDVLQIGVQAEQAPNPDSRVVLGDRRDPFGQRVARLDWRPTADDHASIARSVELLDGAFRSAGIGRIARRFGTEHAPALFIGNWHHMGTTRMHPDPRHGVVDPTGRVHSLANLYVAGGSVFPTAGFANPTLTIVALAVRLADELRQSDWGAIPA
jgi:choline dehydrogenase-like flavoprotein